MDSHQVIDFPQIKIENNEVEVAFELELDLNSPMNTEVQEYEKDLNFDDKINDINEDLAFNNSRLTELNKDIDKLTNHADGIDNMVAVGSGVLAGIVDSFWVGRFSMERGKAWSNEKVNKFVHKVAEAKGYKGDRLDGAIAYLENRYEVASDNTWSGKGVGISAKSHRLDDLSHHPTPIGLLFSILTQFTEKGYFQNRHGEFLPISIDEKDNHLIGHDIPSKIFSGTVNWFFHLVSDMSGSNKTAGAGMGIPGPISSLLKEASLIPGLNKTELPKKINDAFVKERFDLRSELSVGYEVGRQAVPVILNEFIVRSFYFIRRLLMEMKDKQALKEINWQNTLPWKNRTIVRMLTIATGTFTTIDLVDASIRSAIKSGGNPAALGKEIIMHVNFVGVGRFAIAAMIDTSMGIRQNKLRNDRIVLLSEQLHLMNAKTFYLQGNTWIKAKTTEEAINQTIEIAEDATLIAVESWEANKKSLANISTYHEGINKQNNDLVDHISDVLKWG